MNQTITVKNGTITLPKVLQRKWQKAEVFVLPDDDTLVLKKLRKPLMKLSAIASRTASLPRLSAKQIQKEIDASRQGK